MSVSLRQVQIFVAIVRGRSFADACTQLHISQPAVSIAIKNLEEALGGKLLSRTTRAVSLTPEGEVFYAAAQKLLAHWEQSLEDVRNLFSLQRGRLVMAAMPTFAGTLLPTVLVEFQKRFPGIDVAVHDIVAEQVLEQVTSGQIELGVMFDPGDVDGIEFHPLFFDHFVAVLPPKHALLEKDVLRWQDFNDTTFITLQRPSSIRELVMNSLAAQGCSVSPSFEAHQLSVVGRMVTEGLGLSIIPQISANQMREMGAECRRIEPEIGREVGFITHRRRPLSSATSAMAEVLLDWDWETRS